MRWLKDKPVAQGVLGNAIFQTLWQAGSGMTSLIAGHSAYIQGIALHWAILIGAVVLFLLVGGLNLFNSWSRQRLREPGQRLGSSLTSLSEHHKELALLHPATNKGSTAEGSIEHSIAPQIGIVNLIDNQDVGLYEMIYGYVLPPNSQLQVLIYSGDGRWYVQGPVNVRGSAWSIRCQFGGRGVPGGHYQIVAVLGRTLTERSYGYLSDDLVRSTIVPLQRLNVVDG